MATKKRVIEEDNKRVSKSIKKTPNCNYNADGKPCCPSCGTVPGDSVEYESGNVSGEVIFYYICQCGQSFRRKVNIQDI